MGSEVRGVGNHPRTRGDGVRGERGGESLQGSKSGARFERDTESLQGSGRWGERGGDQKGELNINYTLKSI